MILNVTVIAKLPSAVFVTDAQTIKQGVTTKLLNLKQKKFKVPSRVPSTQNNNFND